MEDVEIFTTTFAVPPDNTVTRLGLTDSTGLEPLLGVDVALRLTMPENPPMLVRVIVLVPAEPWVMFIEDGLAVIWKSGGGGRLTSIIAVTP